MFIVNAWWTFFFLLFFAIQNGAFTWLHQGKMTYHSNIGTVRLGQGWVEQ
jgi:hypothetical protein